MCKMAESSKPIWCQAKFPPQGSTCSPTRSKILNYKIWLQTFLMLPPNLILPPFFGHIPQRRRSSGCAIELIINCKIGDFEFDQLLGQPYFSPVGYYKLASVVLIWHSLWTGYLLWYFILCRYKIISRQYMLLYQFEISISPKHRNLYFVILVHFHKIAQILALHFMTFQHQYCKTYFNLSSAQTSKLSALQLFP